MGLQLVKPCPHGHDGLGAQLEHPRPGVLGQSRIGYNARPQQHPQMFAQRGPADTEHVGQLAGPARDNAQQLDNLEPGWVPERVQEVNDVFVVVNHISNR